MTAVQAVGSAVNLALQVSGLKQPQEAGSEPPPYDVSLRVSTGDRLNASAEGEPLSLVVHVYQLRTAQSFSMLSYAQASSPEQAREILGDELVAFKEVVVIPGRSYDLKQTVAGEAAAIGVIGLFRSPAPNRWKIAFDAHTSEAEGITVGAHACALTAGHGAVIDPAEGDLARTLVGVECGG